MNQKVLGYFGIKLQKREEYAVDYVSELLDMGKFCGGPTPYGLIRDPEDKDHLIIDPETAPTVKLIYGLALDGCGIMRIAKYMLEHKIPITRCNTQTNTDYYAWSGSWAARTLAEPPRKSGNR